VTTLSEKIRLFALIFLESIITETPEISKVLSVTVAVPVPNIGMDIAELPAAAAAE
jgi:hypothetical protein